MREGEIFGRAYKSAVARIEKQGLRFEYLSGANLWRKFMDEQQALYPDCPDLFASTAFCPRIHQDLEGSNAHSFVVYDGMTSVAGVVIRSYANKLRHLIEHGGLWLPDADVLLSDFAPAEMPPECPLDARVSQRGGLFVAPPYRHTGGRYFGLGGALSDACDAAAFRLYDHDWSVALKREPKERKMDGIAYLGKASIGTPPLDFWLAWLSRSTCLAGFRHDAADHPDNVTSIVRDRPE